MQGVDSERFKLASHMWEVRSLEICCEEAPKSREFLKLRNIF